MGSKIEWRDCVSCACEVMTHVQLHVAHLIIKLQIFLHVSSRSPSEILVLSPSADKKYFLLYYFQILNFTSILRINNKEAMNKNKLKGGNVLVE